MPDTLLTVAGTENTSVPPTLPAEDRYRGADVWNAQLHVTVVPLVYVQLNDHVTAKYVTGPLVDRVAPVEETTQFATTPARST